MTEFPSQEPNPFQEAFRASDRCPGIERLSEFLDGRMNPAQSSEIQGHVEECPHCRAEVALLHRFESVEPEPQEAADLVWITQRVARHSAEIIDGATTAPAKNRGRFLPRWTGWFAPRHWRGFSLAAASLVAAVSVTLYVRHTAEPPLTPPAPPANEIWRSQRIPVISPPSQVAEAPRSLAWQPVANASVYHVTLKEVDGTEIWSADSTSPEVVLPARIRSQMQPGRAFLWEVVARERAGQVLGTTSLQKFSIPATTR